MKKVPFWRAALLVFCLVLLIPSVSVKSQSSLTVNKLADTNDGVCSASDCSLREAIASAAAGATIGFSSGLTGTIVLGSELLIDKNLSISGPGPSVITVSGNNAVRVFLIRATVSISGLTISQGRIVGDAGGGILNDRATLNLNNVVISGNTALSGAGLTNFVATTTITNSTITGNTSLSGGGGMYLNVGTLTVTNSTIAGNTAPGNGGGIVVQGGNLIVTRSTIANNASIVGGGIHFNGDNLTVANTTITGNTASANGGGGIHSRGTATVTNTTIAGNTNTDNANGSAIYFDGGQLTLKNSIIANNVGGRSCPGGVTDAGNNLQYPDDTCVSSIPVANPLLGALANNGGPTQTMALQSGSPAIDAGDNTTCGASPVGNVDQRVITRPTDGDGNGSTICDIGAFEAPTASITTFYRAINVNGPALTIDGNAWEAGTAPNFTANGTAYDSQGEGLIPTTDPARAQMLSKSVYHWALNMTMSAVPNANYDVYIYVYSSWPQAYTLRLQGQQIYATGNSGPTGTWLKLGPYPVNVTGGTINLTSGGDIVNVSGLEVWRRSPAPTATNTVTNTPTNTATHTPTNTPTITPTPTLAAFSIFVDFNQYADFTPVADFSEAGLTFSSNGIGLTRSLDKSLQVREDGASVTITVVSPASAVQFSYTTAGACAQNAIVELYSGITLVASTPIGYCAPAGVYTRSVGFDRIVITTPGSSNTGEIRLDNLGIVIPGAPTSVPTATFTNTTTPSLTPTLTPTPTRTPFPSGFNHVVFFDGYPDFTPVTAFSEPDLTFSSNGIGLTRALGGQLQIREAGASVTIITPRFADAIQFDYDVAGLCTGNATIELFRDTTLVDSTSVGYCTGKAVYRRSLGFDRIVITTPGVGNTDTILVDNLGINIPSVPNTPTNTATNTPTRTPTTSRSPTLTRSPIGGATATNTPSATPMNTATNTATNTPTFTPMATQTPIPTHTATSTVTPTATILPTSTPTPGTSITFYRAINVNGPALVLDGNPYEGGTAPNFTTNGTLYDTEGGALLPSTDLVRSQMLSTSVYHWALNMTMSAVPNGTYSVYIYVYSSWPQSYALYLQGQQIYSNPNSGPTGTWQKIGPFTTNVTNGTLNLTSGGNIIHVSGIEVWQHTSPAPTFQPATNTRTRTPTRTPIGAGT